MWHDDKDHQVGLRCMHGLRTTNQRWRTAAILTVQDWIQNSHFNSSSGAFRLSRQPMDEEV